MGKLAGHKARAVIRTFESFGWKVRRTTGSHVIMGKEGCEAILSIPVHKGKDVKEGLLRALLRDAGIPVDEFLEEV